MLKPFIGLAPMEGVSNFPTRIFFHLASAPAWTATPFLRVTATYPMKNLPDAYAPELGPARGALPYALAPQMMASEADDFLRAAEHYPTHDGVPFLELNAGCPSPTCVGKGAGSSLLKDPDDFHRTADRLASRLGAGRFALKMRTGYQDAAEYPGLVDGLRDLPLARLTVHGRTRPDGYRGKARWELIGEAARLAKAPVVASGDVVDGASLVALLQKAPGVAGVIVGRGALRNPWIFSELRDGKPVTVSTRCVVAALRTYALLSELHAEKLPALIDLAADGHFVRPCGTGADAWEALAAQLAEVAYPSGTEPPLARATIGRVKMVWNYLRSSLPEPFFEPTVLRQRDLDGLLAAIEAQAASIGGRDAPLTLAHNPSRDWLYAGARRDDQ